MARGWRIVKEKHADTAFSGEGARLYGGRWNSIGQAVVYASSTKSLAALETLVHLLPPVPFCYVSIRIDFPDDLLEELPVSSWPTDWRTSPPSPSTQAVGDQWLRSRRRVALAIPSAIIGGEFNYLLNPSHRDFNKIKIATPEPFTFDPRLLA